MQCKNCYCGYDEGVNFCLDCGTALRPIPFPFPAPAKLRSLCTKWHSGQASSMYSIASTGRIHDDDTLVGLIGELRTCLKNLPPDRDEEAYRLERWKRFAERLESTLNLDDD